MFPVPKRRRRQWSTWFQYKQCSKEKQEIRDETMIDHIDTHNYRHKG